MHTRNISDMSSPKPAASSRTFFSSSWSSLTVSAFSRLSAIAYSGQFQLRKVASSSAKTPRATPQNKSASGIAQTPKPLTVSQHAQPKKKPARNNGKAASCGLLVSYRPHATWQHRTVAAKKNTAKRPIGHVSGIRGLLGNVRKWGAIDKRPELDDRIKTQAAFTRCKTRKDGLLQPICPRERDLVGVACREPCHVVFTEILNIHNGMI